MLIKTTRASLVTSSTSFQPETERMATRRSLNEHDVSQVYRGNSWLFSNCNGCCSIFLEFVLIVEKNYVCVCVYIQGSVE